MADALVIAEAARERPDQLLAEYRRRRRCRCSGPCRYCGVRPGFLPRPVLNIGLLLLPWLARWANRRPERFGRALRNAAEAFRET